LTKGEVKQIVKLLTSQWTLSSIFAKHYSSQGASIETFRKAVAEEGIDVRGLRAAGLSGLRAKAFALVSAMPDEETEFNAAMKYLAKYDTVVDPDEPVDTTSGVDITVSITADIMSELNEQ